MSSTNNINSTNLCKKISSLLNNIDAQDIVEINLCNKSQIADYIIIAEFKSQRQINSAVTHIKKLCKLHSIKSIQVEGEKLTNWIVVDIGVIFVHLFLPETRKYYEIEKIWSL